MWDIAYKWALCSAYNAGGSTLALLIPHMEEIATAVTNFNCMLQETLFPAVQLNNAVIKTCLNPAEMSSMWKFCKWYKLPSIDRFFFDIIMSRIDSHLFGQQLFKCWKHLNFRFPSPSRSGDCLDQKLEFFARMHWENAIVGIIYLIWLPSCTCRL